MADPAQLSRYFTTGGARGRLETGGQVEWDGEATTGENGATRVIFEFAPLDDDSRTLVTITETSWAPTPAGAEAAFGNCQGWTGMLAVLKAWLEHGINLREGFYR